MARNSTLMGTMVSNMGREYDFSFFKVFYMHGVVPVYYETYRIPAVCFTQRFQDIFEIVRERAKKNIESFTIEAYESSC